VVPTVKTSSHYGKFEAAEPGTFNIMLDNTYSKLRSKDVYIAALWTPKPVAAIASVVAVASGADTAGGSGLVQMTTKATKLVHL
jgi:hypothetical protein